MKTLKMFGMAFVAALLSVNFISCSNDDEINVNKQEDKMVTVGLNCVGEILEIEDSPLARSAGNDLYAIQVHQIDEVTDGDATYYHETPYAYGLFTDLTNVTIGLLDGFKYKFEATMVVDGKTNGFYFYINGDFSGYNTFNFSSSSCINNISYVSVNDYKYDRYYGRLDEYTPTTNGNAEIYMKRVSYGAKFVATGLTEGSMNISVAGAVNDNLYSLTLTPETTVDDNIYTFRSITSAYQGTFVQTGYDSETDSPICTYIDDYEETNSITFSWTKADGTVTPLGTYDIPFKRNVKTTVTIKVEEITNENGIIVTKEETAMADDENEYQIEGGSVTVVPVTSGN